MEMNIGEVNSTVRATDGAALLSPDVLERIVRAVLARLHEENKHHERVASEKSLVRGVAEEI